jgi:hypothetical protein
MKTGFGRLERVLFLLGLCGGAFTLTYRLTAQKPLSVPVVQVEAPPICLAPHVSTEAAYSTNGGVTWTSASMPTSRNWTTTAPHSALCCTATATGGCTVTGYVGP